jgi:hypothetical protein
VEGNQTVSDRVSACVPSRHRPGGEHGHVVKWLRGKANLRSAPIVGAALFATERLARGESGTSRPVMDSVLLRADEPGELLAYWTGAFGRTIPKPVKRGIADAVVRLYNERSLLKYDTAAKGFRFADVIELVHPRAVNARQGDLFKYAIDRRHDRRRRSRPRCSAWCRRCGASPR